MPLKASPRLILGGLVTYSAAALGVFVYLRKSAPAPDGPAAAGGGGGGGGSGDGASVFDSIAETYDSSIDWDENLMGVKLLRRWLVRQAQGDVLETSAGTGRNLAYYDPAKVNTLTVTDRSREMLRAAHEKSRALEAKQQVRQTSFALSDCARLVGPGASGPRGAAAPSGRPDLDEPRAFPPESFDTVVQTFGLCSHSDPVAALKEMGRVCKRDGRILLLEHGRSHYGLINRLLDDGAEQHYRKWGCRWNRSIDELVAEAGLQVVSVSRWHFGTTYRIEARPGAGSLETGRRE